MNKKTINEMLPKAYDTLKDIGIANDKLEIDPVFRSYISSYGAAIVMGSLLAATAFFSAQRGAKEDRGLLMNAIYYLIIWDKEGTKPKKPENDSLFKYVRAKGGGAEVKESVINAAISLKLAMNLYAEKKTKTEEKTNKEGKKDES